MTTLDKPMRDTLSTQAMETMREYFDRQGHHPSPEHWGALADVARTLADMADGVAASKIFLSAIDPGVGKSQTVIHFARALVASPDHRDVGMLICVGRLAEAKAIAQALAIPKEHLAVLTSDDDTNAFGGAAVDAAQILVTTQQRLERITDGHSFCDVGALHFEGKPRQVRVWDEAFLPGIAVTLNRDDLCFLPKLVRPMSPDCADALLRFAASLTDKQDGDAVDVPDFGAVYGVSLYEVLASAAGASGRLRDDQQMAATALLTLSGKAARVRRDGRSGSTILTYRDTLPADLAPLVVLDASGRVRATYAWMEQHRGSLVRLREAIKDYTPLTIHTWQTSGSKSGFENNGDVLVRGIIKTILTKPDEKWLVVMHKPGGRVRDVDKAVRRGLPQAVTVNVSTITWGNHMATNAYADVPNVILAGTLFMRDSFYTALTHLAQNRDVAPGLVSPAAVAETMRGEHAHLCLQAICRGRVRRSDGSQCHPMTAYVIASPRSGIPRELTTIFPGCTVVPWKATIEKLQGHIKAAVEYVQDALGRGETWIPFTKIREKLRLDRSNFRKLVLDKSAWKSAVSGLAVVEAEGPHRSKGFLAAS